MGWKKNKITFKKKENINREELMIVGMKNFQTDQCDSGVVEGGVRETAVGESVFSIGFCLLFPLDSKMSENANGVC